MAREANAGAAIVGMGKAARTMAALRTMQLAMKPRMPGWKRKAIQLERTKEWQRRTVKMEMRAGSLGSRETRRKTTATETKVAAS